MSKDRRAFHLVEDGPAKQHNPTAQAGNSKFVNRSGVNVGAFKCDICVASFTSYDAYLDHTHSRLHQRNAGMADTDNKIDDPARIRARLRYLKEKRETRQTVKRRLEEEPIQVVEERIAQRKLEEEQKRREKRQKKDKLKKKDEQQLDEETRLMASVMGISSFK